MADDLLKLAERPCCERRSLRTIYRGWLGCVEQCERCGFTYAFDTEGEPTDATRAALRARANSGEDH